MGEFWSKLEPGNGKEDSNRHNLVFLVHEYIFHADYYAQSFNRTSKSNIRKGNGSGEAEYIQGKSLA